MNLWNRAIESFTRIFSSSFSRNSDISFGFHTEPSSQTPQGVSYGILQEIHSGISPEISSGIPPGFLRDFTRNSISFFFWVSVKDITCDSSQDSCLGFYWDSSIDSSQHLFWDSFDDSYWNFARDSIRLFHIFPGNSPGFSLDIFLWIASGISFTDFSLDRNYFRVSFRSHSEIFFRDSSRYSYRFLPGICPGTFYGFSRDYFKNSSLNSFSDLSPRLSSGIPLVFLQACFPGDFSSKFIREFLPSTKLFFNFFQDKFSSFENVWNQRC